MGCDFELRSTYSPRLADFGAISAGSMDEIVSPAQRLLTSRSARSPHLTDFGVCLRIELARLLAGTHSGQQEDEVYLRLMRRGVFVQKTRARLMLSRLWFACLLIGTKSTKRRCIRDRTRRLCIFRPEKINDGQSLLLWRGGYWYLATALIPLSISWRGWHRARLGRSEHLLLHEHFHYSLGHG